MKEIVHLTWKKFAYYLLLFASLTAAGFFYILFVKAKPKLVTECMMKKIFHLYCPGCGGTHALNSLFHFHIAESFLYNPLVLYMALGVLIFIVKSLVLLIKGKGETDVSIDLRYLWGLFYLMLFFFIIRNVLLIFFGVDYLGELRDYWHLPY